MLRYDSLPHPDLQSRRGTRHATAAPRGAAKSTIRTLLFPLMDLCLAREKYIVILSATLAQATGRLTALAGELKSSSLLTEDFFVESPARKKWSRSRIEWNGVRIDAYGAGAEIRGISFDGYRPTKIILDDVEHGRLAMKAAGRKQLWEWYTEVVENLGDTYTHIEAVGTILHRDSLLTRLLEHPRYEGKIYKSVIGWSNSPRLWQEWAKLYTDRTDEKRSETARRYFSRRKKDMLQGTEVLWEEKESYYCLMETLINTGRHAFFKEKQNSPFAKEGRVFDTSVWPRFKPAAGVFYRVTRTVEESVPDNDGLFLFGYQNNKVLSNQIAEYKNMPSQKLGKVSDCAVFGFLDPALGRGRSNGTGDFAAVVTIGRDSRGNVFVLDVWMERARPDRQVQRIYELHGQYGYTAFGFESNGFQEVLARHFEDEEKRRVALGMHNGAGKFPLRAIRNRLNKEARILAMEYRITAGSMIFRDDLPEEFFVQADEFPHGAHDDGIDALASCLELSDEIMGQKAGRITSITRKTGRGY